MSKKEPREIKLFGKWSFKDIAVKDLGLKDYISLKPVYVPHSMGRHEHKKFHKSQVNIVERFVNNIMHPGPNMGKKVRAINIAKNAFELVHLQIGENPIQVLVRAIENSAPCEDTTRISYGGIVYHMSVDISPQRRVDLALRLLCEGARNAAFSNPRSLEEILAEEIISAASNNVKSFAVSKRHEMERVAFSSR